MSSLEQLKEFLSNQSPEKDPFWLSVLQSDTRNIFPKYEMCKIQIMKNNLSKIRLMMENLSSFTTLEIHKKQQRQDLQNLNVNIQAEVDEIVSEQGREKTRQMHYDTELSKRKRQIQYLCKQLSKSKVSRQIQQLLIKNKAWREYFEKNLVKLQSVSNKRQVANNINLSKHVSLDVQVFNPLIQKESIRNVFTSGTSGRIYEERLKEKILIQKLVNDLYYSGSTEEKLTESNQNDDIWAKEIQEIKERFKI